MDEVAQARTVAYGSGPDQVADLRVPPGRSPADGWPAVVLVHGGFWKDRYRRDLMVPLASALAARGWASWNLEYRRVGPTGGGVPETLLDVATAVDLLVEVADEDVLDLRRVAVVGHSAGGQLALWLASRGRLPAGVPGSSPRIVPAAVVAQAPVTSLVHALDLGDGAVEAFLGGPPSSVPDRYALADPIGLVGHAVPTLLVHGEADVTVPVDQSERYEAAACAAGDPVGLHVGPGHHHDVIDPEGALWAAAEVFLERLR